MKSRFRHPPLYFINRGIIYLWALFIIFILVWMVSASLKTNQQMFSSIWSLPSAFKLSNYAKAWMSVDLQRYFLNSIVTVGIAVAGIVLFSAPAAYILSRVKFPGSTLLNNSMIIGIGIPYQMVIIPLFQQLTRMHLHNTLFGLITVYIALSLPFSVYLLTGFFKTLPYEIEEASAIDGASANQTFWTIMLPMARPGLITVMILNAVSLWNEFLLVLTFITDNSKYTLSRGLYAFFQTMQYNSDWVSLFAGVVIVVLPILIAYLWLSDRIIEGMTMGSGK